MSEDVLVYDDDCGFCTWWADYFDERSDVRIVGFSDLTPELRDRLPEDYEECSHFVTDDGVYSCGASIEEAFARSGIVDGAESAVRFLRQFGDYESTRESVYRWVADNRSLWGEFLSKTPPARMDRTDADER